MAINPKHGGALELLGRLYFRQEDFENAIAMFQKELKVCMEESNVASVHPIKLLCDSFLQLHKIADAELLVENALQSLPTNEELLILREAIQRGRSRSNP